MRVSFLCTLNRWISEEYDWFYLEGAAQSFRFQVSAAAAGDAGDALNVANSPTHGSYFYVLSSNTFCTNSYGSGWYSSTGSCLHWRGLGGGSSGFKWFDQPVQIGRMMVKP